MPLLNNIQVIHSLHSIDIENRHTDIERQGQFSLT